MENDEIFKFGNIYQEGLQINDCRSLLLNNGRVVAVAVGHIIQLHNIADGRMVDKIILHTSNVVGLTMDAMHPERCVSCDEEGNLYWWAVGGTIVDSGHIGKFPIPPTGAVEHLAHLSASGAVVLAVAMNRGTGPRELLLEENRDEMPETRERYDVLVSDLVHGPNMLDFGSSPEDFGAAIIDTIMDNEQRRAVYIVRVKTPKAFRGGSGHTILMALRVPTCVAVHPIEDTVAVGDHFGGVELYHNVLVHGNHVRRRFHWHHMPVNDLLFSSTGMELLSCGHEAVLVQWHVGGNEEDKPRYMARLGQPLLKLSQSSDQSICIVEHPDHSFSVINLHEWKLKGVILGHGFHHGGPSNVDTIKDKIYDVKPVLLYDERTQCVVTKARRGHLNFHHMHSHEQVLMLDVVYENFVPDASGERHITHVSLCSRGLNLVTVDRVLTPSTHNHNDLQQQLQQLKFWEFNGWNQKWDLKTSVTSPHTGEVEGCLLQPWLPRHHCELGEYGDEIIPISPDVLTWGSEGDVKIWRADRENKLISWACVEETSYRDAVAARDACWAPAGPVAAMAHGPAITLWATDPLQYSCTLSKAATFHEDVNIVRFSPRNCGRVVVGCTASWLQAWDLSTRRLMYAVPLAVVALEGDVRTKLMAAATTDGELIVFRAEDGNPLCIVDTSSVSLSARSQMTLLFCPPQTSGRRTDNNATTAVVATTLVFFNGEQKLNSVSIFSGVDLEESDVKVLEYNPEDYDMEVLPDKQEESRVPSKFSLMLTGTRAKTGQAESLFSFRQHDNNAYIKPDIFTKELDEQGAINYQLTAFSQLLLSFDKELNCRLN